MPGGGSWSTRAAFSTSSTVTGSEADLAGKVAIGLPPSLGQVLTMPLVKAFRERYRSAELAIMEALSVPLQERLLAGRVDVAVIHNPTPSPLLKIEPMLTEGAGCPGARAPKRSHSARSNNSN